MFGPDNAIKRPQRMLPVTGFAYRRPGTSGPPT